MVYEIENDCKHSIKKINEVSDISRNFCARSQQAVSASEEQAEEMIQIEENLEEISKDDIQAG